MASIKVALHIEMEDGNEYDVVADQRDYANWEAQPFGSSAADMESKPMLAARFLAYSALHRSGTYTKVWDTFTKHCVEVSYVGEVETGKAGDQGQ